MDVTALILVLVVVANALISIAKHVCSPETFARKAVEGLGLTAFAVAMILLVLALGKFVLDRL